MAGDDPQTRNLLDYLYVVVRWRRLIVVGTLVAAAAVAGVSLIVPERWTARTSLLPPDDDSGGFSLSMLGGGTGSGLPASLAGLIGASTPSERLLTLLDSRRLLGLAVDRHGLVEDYGAQDRDEAIDILTEDIERELGADGSLAIQVTASTPKLAAALTNTLAGLLDSLNREYRQRQARSMRTFLDERLRRTRADAAVDAGALRRFQKTHGVVDIEAQTAAAVEVVKGIVQELSMLEVELGVMSRQLSPDHPDRQLLEMKVEELRRRLRLMVGDLSAEVGDDPAIRNALGPPLLELPDVMHEYAQLTLETKVREQILAYLGARLEEAKYREALDTPTLQVLDPATPPRVRSAPKRVLLTAAGGGTALVLLTLLAFVLETWQRCGLEADGRLEAIRRELQR